MIKPAPLLPVYFSPRKLLTLLILMAWALGGCYGLANSGTQDIPPSTGTLTAPFTPSSPLPTFAGPASPQPGDWYSIYFTDPEDPASASLRGGPDAALAEAIRSARLSVDLAVLDLNLWSIRDALLDAHRSGATVRVVVDSDNLDREELQSLVTAGVPVVGDQRNGLMHDKFTVIDRQQVWTGSMNYTTSDGYRNANNLIRIHSSQVAEDYTAEFEEMFTSRQFGAESPANTPNPTVTLDSARLEVYFSPDDGTAGRLEALLRSAQESIYFLAYSFTADKLGSAIIDRAQSGVKVAGVMDASQVGSNQGTEYPRFRKTGLDVSKDGLQGNMHDKVLIIDGKIVVTGSYNFSRNAEETNDENTLIIYDAEIARLYIEHFNEIYSDAKQ